MNLRPSRDSDQAEPVAAALGLHAPLARKIQAAEGELDHARNAGLPSVVGMLQMSTCGWTVLIIPGVEADEARLAAARFSGIFRGHQ
jgi:hypothetical protein